MTELLTSVPTPISNDPYFKNIHITLLSLLLLLFPINSVDAY